MKQKTIQQYRTCLVLLFILTTSLSFSAPTTDSPNDQNLAVWNTIKKHAYNMQQRAKNFGKCVLGHEPYTREEIQIARAQVTAVFIAAVALIITIKKCCLPCLFRQRTRADAPLGGSQPQRQLQEQSSTGLGVSAAEAPPASRARAPRRVAQPKLTYEQQDVLNQRAQALLGLNARATVWEVSKLQADIADSNETFETLSARIVKLEERLGRFNWFFNWFLEKRK